MQQTPPVGIGSWMRPKTLGYIAIWMLWSGGVFYVWGHQNGNAIQSEVSMLATKEVVTASSTPTSNEKNSAIEHSAIEQEATSLDISDPIKETLEPLSSPNADHSFDTKEAYSEKTEDSDYILKIFFKEGSSMWTEDQDVHSLVAAIEKEALANGDRLIIEAYDTANGDAKASLELSKRRAWRIRSLFKNKQFRRKSLEWNYYGDQIPKDVKDQSSYQHEPIALIKKQIEP